MIALVAALAFAQTGSTPTRPTLTLTTRGETVSALLKEASRLTGAPMEATGRTTNEIVIVSVKDVPVAVFQEKLAKAIGASWRREGSTMRLTRTNSEEQAQEAAERAIEIKEISATIDNLRKKLASQPVFDDKAAQGLAIRFAAVYTKYKGHLGDSPGLEASMALEPEMPVGRLATAALAVLTPAQLADLGPGGRIVYSTRPTAMQRPLPEKIVEAARRYVSEQEIYVNALKRQPNAESMTHWTSEAAETKREPAGIMFSTERSLYNPSLTVRIKLVAADGTIQDESSTLFETPQIKETTAPLGKGTIALSPNSERLYKGFKQLEAGKTYVQDPVLIEALLNPEKTDPLSFVAADGLLGLAGQRNLVACVSDDAYVEPIFTCVDKEGKLDLAKFSDYLSGNSYVTMDDAWMVASPKQPVLARTMRVDRSAEGTFFRRVLANGGATIEDMADLVTKMPKLYSETIVPMTAFFVLPELNAAITDRNVEFLRVYGRLSPQQKQQFQAGNPIKAGVLPAESRADLNLLVYRADSPIEIFFETKPGQPAPKNNVDMEVTVALPNGVPDTAELSMQSNTTEAVIPDGGSTTTSSYDPLSAGSLGYFLARAERADPTDAREQFHVEKYRFVHTRNVMFHMTLTHNTAIDSDCKETKSGPKNASVPFDQLPADFRKQVADAMVQARKRLDEEAKAKTKQVIPPSPAPLR